MIQDKGETFLNAAFAGGFYSKIPRLNQAIKMRKCEFNIIEILVSNSGEQY